MATSIRAVARQAGVSTSTVSRYVKGELKVKKDTEHKILKAISELGWQYSPELGQSPKNINLIVPNLNNPFFSALASSLNEYASDLGINLVIKISGGSKTSETTILQSLIYDQNCDGIIHVGNNVLNDALKIHSVNKPIVFLDEPVIEKLPVGSYSVSADNENGAYQATQYLLQMGHTEIALVSGPEGVPTANAREAGYRKALQQNGFPVDPTLIFHGEYSEAFGASILPELMRMKKRPSAVFVASDIVAIGMLGAASEFGIQIPDDLSIVGFDSINLCEWLRPKLTSVQQPVKQMARAAISSLIEPAEKTPTQQCFPMQLIIRASVQSNPVR